MSDVERLWWIAREASDAAKAALECWRRARGGAESDRLIAVERWHVADEKAREAWRAYHAAMREAGTGAR